MQNYKKWKKEIDKILQENTFFMRKTKFCAVSNNKPCACTLDLCESGNCDFVKSENVKYAIVPEMSCSNLFYLWAGLQDYETEKI